MRTQVGIIGSGPSGLLLARGQRAEPGRLGYLLPLPCPHRLLPGKAHRPAGSLVVAIAFAIKRSKK